MILDQYLQAYFLHVHPILPMLSQSDFWDAYGNPEPPSSKTTSLFLIQAMLFAACSFVPLKTINSLGYKSIRSARAEFYRKAKLIYDFGLEPSTMQTAQAALLLTFWNPPMRADSKPNSMWLMIAIENAKKFEADRYSDVSTLAVRDGSERATLTRLWWCCIIRDRILPLGLRREIQITPAHFDFQKNQRLGCLELQAEIRRSRSHSERSRDGLSIIIEQIVSFSIILGDILLLVFPQKKTLNCLADIQLSKAKLAKCKEALSKWYDESTLCEDNADKYTADQPVITNLSLLYIYYHWANIVLCHYGMRGAVMAPEGSSETRIVKQDRALAHKSAIGIVENLERLTQLDLLRCLPITVVAYTAFPLAMHIFHAECSDIIDGRKHLSERRLGTLIRAMKVFHEQYDGVDAVIKMIRQIISFIRQYASGFLVNTICSDQHLACNPGLDVRVSLAIDWSLSSGRPADEEDFLVYLQALFQGPSLVVSAASPVDVDEERPGDNNGSQLEDVEKGMKEQQAPHHEILPSPSDMDFSENVNWDPFVGCDVGMDDFVLEDLQQV